MVLSGIGQESKNRYHMSQGLGSGSIIRKHIHSSVLSRAGALPTSTRQAGRQDTSVKPARDRKHEASLKARLQSAKLCAQSSFWQKTERNPG